MDVLLITGQSGAGKTRALDVLEDMGFYCIDNMPPSLIPVFVEMAKQLNRFSRVAVVTDARTGELLGGLVDCIAELRRGGEQPRLLYLAAADDVLERRYRETRRRHPLMFGEQDDLCSAIAAEREMLKPAYELADYRIDTSALSPAQLCKRLEQQFSEGGERMMSVRCISFGYKYGVPTESDLLFDVRCLPNPFYIEELRSKTGEDAEVRDYVFAQKQTLETLKRIYNLIDYLLPLYSDEGKTQLVIGVGCTGGHHRSVAIANALSEHIAGRGFVSRAVHRDIGKVL